MKIFKTIKSYREHSKTNDLGFVATMGALHEGHGSLIQRSIKENKQTCVSIFVNPTQFNETKDFETYPDTREEDLRFCESLGVDFVFCPNVDEIYGPGKSVVLSEGEITKAFEGVHRPGHFEGVLQVVLKLLNIVSPQKAYFGKKDYQQYLLIKKMTEEFFINTEIVGVEISRDEFGLARSSRNLNLTKEGLALAQKIAEIFLKTKTENEFIKILDNKVELEYYGIRWGRVLMAHYVDGVRLIDNKEEV